MRHGGALLDWYDTVRRDFPWRDTSDPYLILVSEVMLQQTQAARVVPFYERFVRRFPDAASLAGADLTEVLSLWKGLGYPSRAIRLRDAARLIVKHGWPDDLEELPGVGPYTAAAVASFAFGHDIAVVDTNVKRVVSRWEGTPLSGASLTAEAQDLLGQPSDRWNQAMMELGALLCRPKDPRCDECPVEHSCTDPSIYQPPPRQAPFRGSMRQARGKVLDALLAAAPAPLGHAELADLSTVEAGLVTRVVEGLVADGLVATGADGATLAD